MLAQGERLVLRSMGHDGRKRAYLLPIPPQGPERRKFTLLTSVSVDASGESDRLEVLFCSVFPLQAGHSASLFSMNMELSGDSTGAGSTRLACKNAAEDIVILPASTKASQHPFDKNPPFSYLQYTLETLSEHQFVAVVDKSHSQSGDFVIAEFSTNSEAQIVSNIGVRHLLGSALHLTLPAERPLVMNLKMPALESSLLSYHMSFSPSTCGDADSLFQPLVRQYISDVYESKFFVNVRDADVNVHGIAPYMPPSLRAEDGRDGLSFQIWSDSTCQSSIQLSISLDVLGSFGKLWMRYRTIFASFPLLVVALVMSKQFKAYDESGKTLSSLLMHVSLTNKPQASS
jgi:hypothetical protein